VEWASTDRTVETTLGFIRATRRQIADNDGLQTAVVDPGGAIVGVVGVHHLDWANGKTSIGYWLARDAQGRGVMTAAVRAYVDYAFTTLGLHRVEIEAAVENVRSRAIPQRLGFREEGIRREVERVGERRLDRVVYAVLADEWPGA
jgi:ribosomal-protein-serine acetyltransferase